MLVENWEFIREFNEWLNQHYAEQLKKETRHYLPETEDEKKYLTDWIDYLTDDMWGFDDEYSVCNECQKVFRRIGALGEGHGTILYDGFLICDDCVREKYAENYLQNLINNHKNANTILFTSDLYSLGFDKVNDFPYEHGFYGRVDNPERIMKQMQKENANREYIFSIRNFGDNPFCTEFDLWERESSNEDSTNDEDAA